MVLTLHLANEDGSERVVTGRTTLDCFPAVEQWAAERGFTAVRKLVPHDLEVILSKSVTPSGFQAKLKPFIRAERVPHRTVGGQLVTLPELAQRRTRPEAVAASAGK